MRNTQQKSDRKPASFQTNIHSAFKQLKMEKDGRSLEQLYDEAGEQYLRRRGYHPDDLKQSTQKQS